MEDLSFYNPVGSDLRKVQLRMLEILIYVDSVCQKNDIKYWLSAGTLLGAVRHKGFIPWDDDLDIEMTKTDYRKLIRILKKDPSEKYILQSHQNERNYVLPYAKLRDRSSRIVELKKANRNYKHQGIFIDLFFLDNGNRYLARFTNTLQKGIYALTLVKNDPVGLLLITKTVMRAIIHNMIFPLLRLYSRIFCKESFILPFGTGFTAPRDLRDIFPLKKIEFEGRLFNAPSNCDAYLKKIYGDFMKVPDKEKRQIHSTCYEFL